MILYDYNYNIIVTNTCGICPRFRFVPFLLREQSINVNKVSSSPRTCGKPISPLYENMLKFLNSKAYCCKKLKFF